MGFLSNLLDRLKSDTAVDYTHVYIDDGSAPQYARTDTHYVRVWLRSAHIVDVRRWSSKFHATVHGQFVYVDRLQGTREVMSIVAPDKAFEEIDPHNLDRFIVVNQPLLGPIPYCGELAIDVALFSNDPRLVLVSEGDSWFQFPLFLEDVIDQIFDDFTIWSVDAAGDTLQNMVLNDAEYLQALRQNKTEVRAFLFSGGGNDIVGEDDAGKSIIAQIIKPFEAGRSPEWYLDTEEFAAKLRFIEMCYRTVISNVSAECAGLPVICHGYDYVIPGGGPGDTRHPFWATQDKWIGRAMREDLGIRDHRLQRNIVHLMIDRLNERLKSLCGGNNLNGAFRNAWLVDIRGTVGMRWADELHPTDTGFRRVAARFLDVLRSAGIERVA